MTTLPRVLSRLARTLIVLTEAVRDGDGDGRINDGRPDEGPAMTADQKAAARRAKANARARSKRAAALAQKRGLASPPATRAPQQPTPRRDPLNNPVPPSVTAGRPLSGYPAPTPRKKSAKEKSEKAYTDGYRDGYLKKAKANNPMKADYEQGYSSGNGDRMSGDVDKDEIDDSGYDSWKNWWNAFNDEDEDD